MKVKFSEVLVGTTFAIANSKRKFLKIKPILQCNSADQDFFLKVNSVDLELFEFDLVYPDTLCRVKCFKFSDVKVGQSFLYSTQNYTRIPEIKLNGVILFNSANNASNKLHLITDNSMVVITKLNKGHVTELSTQHGDEHFHWSNKGC